MSVARAPRPSRRTSWLVRASVLALAAGLMTAAPAGVLNAQKSVAATTTEAAAATVPAASATHPFSAPIWSPLRVPAKVSCVKTNCTGTGGDYHGYWAIDFLGQRGDGIYAAGAGIFHIGAQEKTCGTGGTQTAGTWAWVDHGGGKVSKYKHLDTITVAEGALVTPATKIGTMGHWGDTEPCTTNYLHFEVREGGINGTRVDPGTLRACLPTGMVLLPTYLNGSTSFDTLPKALYRTPAADSSCVTDVWNKTPAQPTMTATRAPSSAVLAWSTPPAGTTSVRVTTELWGSSVKAWHAATYKSVATTARGTTITGLTNGKTYRFRVTFGNSAGFSAWSVARSVIPATVPSAPPSPRFLTSPYPTYVHYGWYRSAANGAAVTKYTTQVRCSKSGVWQAWRSATTDDSVIYYNHYGVSGYTYCQVRVNATNAMGTSAWSTVSSITKKA
jgi:hypothetical protein